MITFYHYLTLNRFNVHTFSAALVSPNITQSPQSITAVAGTDITLECRATGDPIPSMQWLNNYAPIAPVYETVSRPGYGKLVIKYSSTGDNGTYQCLFTNIKATATSKIANVYVSGI